MPKTIDELRGEIADQTKLVQSIRDYDILKDELATLRALEKELEEYEALEQQMWDTARYIDQYDDRWNYEI